MLNTYYISTPTGDRELQVYWPTGVSRLAVMVSGGYDSGLMLWLWANIKLDGSAKLIPVCVDRGFGSTESARMMVDKVNTLTNQHLELLILPVSPDLHHSKHLIVPAGAAIKDSLFDFVISADNAVPDHLVQNSPQRARLADQFSSKIWHLPFLHLDKTHIVKLVNDLGLNWIPELSHSCTVLSDSRCQQCWQCTERIWAHNVLGIPDTGVR
jgi:hypothetical protein